MSKCRNYFQPDNDEDSQTFLSRAANVLTCLSEGRYILTDIAKHCNMGTSTTHRLLATLAKPGFAIYDPIDHRYYLGPKVAQLASNPVTSHQYLIMAVNRDMEQLARECDETVTLSLMVGIRYIPLHAIFSSRRSLVLEEYRGSRPVIPLGATDLILLSQLPQKELRQALKIGQDWLGPRDHTIQDVATWEAKLAEIRQAGYAVTRGEKIIGGTGIAVPVANYFCPVALTIIGPESRLEPQSTKLVNKLNRSGKRLSRILADLFS